jgi:fructose/tagatose bisphosphate aldolase
MTSRIEAESAGGNKLPSVLASEQLSGGNLHGASGLPEGDLRRVVSLRVAIFNVNTELRAAYFLRLGEELGAKAAKLNLKGLGDGVVEAVQEVVEAKLSAFGWS